MKKSEAAALDAVEAILGYHFTDRQLLSTALTHASAASGAASTYQRLEFLGDRVLGLVIATVLYETFPAAAEGDLSRRLADLVRKETCAAVAQSLGLADAVKIERGRSKRDSILTVNVLGDITEALIAALYLDGGLEAARRFVLANWRERVQTIETTRRDAKTTLQEWVQARGLPTPTYAIVDRAGPDHDTRFTVEVRIETLTPGRGEGRSRRDAEQTAAAGVLVREGVWEEALHAGP